MVTKNQVNKLLEKDLTPKEIVRLMVKDAHDAIGRTEDSFSIMDELTLTEADTQKLRKNQTQEEAYITGQWLEAWEKTGFIQAQAQIEGLEAMEFIQVLSAKLSTINLMDSLRYEEMSHPALMTQKEYEEKKQALWEHESSEQIPVINVVREKAQVLCEERENCNYNSIPKEIYEEASQWVKNLITVHGLKPKEMDEPIAETGYKFEESKELDIENWPFKYFTQGELAEVEDSPWSYIKDFDPDRYTEKVEGEPPEGFIPPRVATVQDPPDYMTDERGWYKPDKSHWEIVRERIEPDRDEEPQKFYDTIRDPGIERRIATFKALKYIVSHFYKALGLEIEELSKEIKETEKRIRIHLMDYEDRVDALKGVGEKAIWHWSTGEEVEFKPIDYNSIEPSQDTIEDWAEGLDEYLGEGWINREEVKVV